MNAIRHLLVLLAGCFVVSTSGCKSERSESARVELFVSAASSLTEAFQELERGFEALHPGLDVKTTFAGSRVLRLQIEQGARVDVFASANESHIEALVASGHVTLSRVFAHNQLVVIVPTSNPARIEAFEDLGKASRIVIGTDQVPVGIYTRQLLERAGQKLGNHFVDEVRRRIVSEENNVRLVRAKVEMGEADAAIVYRTDAIDSDRVRMVSIPDPLNPRASYPIGTVTRAPRAREAREFVSYVLSPAGREALRRHGFIEEDE